MGNHLPLEEREQKAVAKASAILRRVIINENGFTSYFDIRPFRNPQTKLELHVYVHPSHAATMEEVLMEKHQVNGMHVLIKEEDEDYVMA